MKILSKEELGELKKIKEACFYFYELHCKQNPEFRNYLWDSLFTAEQNDYLDRLARSQRNGGVENENQEIPNNVLFLRAKGSR